MRCTARSLLTNPAGSATTQRERLPPSPRFRDCTRANPNRRGSPAGAPAAPLSRATTSSVARRLAYRANGQDQAIHQLALGEARTTPGGVLRIPSGALATLREAAEGHGQRRCGNDRAAPLSRPWPVDIPFDHEDVRVYIDSLFLDGLLFPTDVLPKASVEGTWVTVGVRGDEVEDAQFGLRGLATRLDSRFPRMRTAIEHGPRLRGVGLESERLAMDAGGPSTPCKGACDRGAC